MDTQAHKPAFRALHHSLCSSSALQCAVLLSIFAGSYSTVITACNEQADDNTDSSLQRWPACSLPHLKVPHHGVHKLLSLDVFIGLLGQQRLGALCDPEQAVHLLQIRSSDLLASGLRGSRA